jgi:hypothetical protein
LRNSEGIDSVCLYVDIKCPFCGDVFEATAASVEKNKSNVCKAHLANKKCNLPATQQGGADATIIALPPSKRARSAAVLHKQCVPVSRFAELEERTAGLEQRTACLERDRDLFVDNMIAAFPSMTRPLVADNVVHQVKTEFCISYGSNPSTRGQDTRLSDQLGDKELESEQKDRRLLALQRRNDTLEREISSMRSRVERVESGQELKLQANLYKRELNERLSADEMFSQLDTYLNDRPRTSAAARRARLRE